MADGVIKRTIGPVGAYAGAKTYGGFSGTKEEFYTDLGNSARNALSARDSMEAAGRSATAAEQSADRAQEIADNIDTNVTKALSGIESAGVEQVQAVQDAGTEQVSAVKAEGEAQTANAKAQADRAEQYVVDVTSLRDSAVAAIQTEGTTQIDAVQAKGTEQVQAVQDAGTEQVSAATEQANRAAESATAAQTAQTAAETARTGAETARTGAETAQSSATESRTAAAASATAAENSATEAAESADEAKQAAVDAKASDAGAVRKVVESFEAYPLLTASGSPLTLTDASANPVKKLTAHIEPVQDFHGYDHPWPGGAGKNLIGVLGEEINISGVIASNKKAVRSEIIKVDPGTIFSFHKNTSLSSGENCTTRLYDADKNYIRNGTGLGYASLSATYTVPDDVGYVGFVQYFQDNATQDLLDSYQIQIEEGTATSYEPYANICPIEGFDKVEVQRTGKNLLPLKLDTIKRVNSLVTWSGNSYTRNGVTFTIETDSNENVTGILVNGTSTALASLVLIDINSINNPNIGLPDGNYILSGCPTDFDKNTIEIQLSYFDESDTVKYIIAREKSGIEFSVPRTDFSRISSFNITVRNGQTANNLLFKPMLRLATDTDDTFEPYQSQTVLTPLWYPTPNLINYDVWKTVGIYNGTAVWENNGVTLSASGNGCYTSYNINGERYIFPEGAKIPVSEGETVIMTWESDSSLSGRCYLFGNGLTENAIYADNNSAKELEYHVPSGITFITFRFGVQNTGTTISYSNIQIRKASPVTNLLDINAESQTINGVTFTVDKEAGTVTANGTANGNSDFTINQNFDGTNIQQDMILSGCPQGGGGNSFRVNMANVGQDFGSGVSIPAGSSGRVYIRIVSGYTANNLVFRPLIRRADDAVYGGTLDVETGELTVNRGIVTIDGSYDGDARASTSTPETGNMYLSRTITGLDDVHEIKYKTAFSDTFKKAKSLNEASTGDFLFTIPSTYSEGQGYLTLRFVLPDEYNTVEKAKSWVVNNPFTINYQLLNPKTYHLTPAQMSTLLGINHISANSGAVDVTYRADMALAWDELASIDNLKVEMGADVTESGLVTLTNNQQFPFNNSEQTIALSTTRGTADYVVLTEVTDFDGNVGEVEVADKLTNGFKLSYTGSAASAKIAYSVRGGK